jgi:hypothetical protein
MTLTLLTAVLLSTAVPDETQPPPEDQFAGYAARRHLELGMGFLGGVRDETRVGFVFAGGTAESIPYAQALTTPFALKPYDRAIVYGIGWEGRYVAQHIRFTVGLQKPNASFRMMDAIFPTDVGGVTRDVGTRSLNLWDVRFGLGTEYAFKYAAPFVDVVGDMQAVKASMTIDGQTARYEAWTFGLAVRAGVRFNMGGGVFIAPMGEVGIGGPVMWGASLQAGWVVPLDRV